MMVERKRTSKLAEGKRLRQIAKAYRSFQLSKLKNQDTAEKQATECAETGTLK
jgi:hypothetical protein